VNLVAMILGYALMILGGVFLATVLLAFALDYMLPRWGVVTALCAWIRAGKPGKDKVQP